MKTQRNSFIVKNNLTLYNTITKETVTGDLINEDEIEGKKFYVLKVGQRTLKLAKDAYTPKRGVVNLLTSIR